MNRAQMNRAQMYYQLLSSFWSLVNDLRTFGLKIHRYRCAYLTYYSLQCTVSLRIHFLVTVLGVHRISAKNDDVHTATPM